MKTKFEKCKYWITCWRHHIKQSFPLSDHRPHFTTDTVLKCKQNDLWRNFLSNKPPENVSGSFRKKLAWNLRNKNVLSNFIVQIYEEKILKTSLLMYCNWRFTRWKFYENYLILKLADRTCLEIENKMSHLANEGDDFTSNFVLCEYYLLKLFTNTSLP